MGTSAETTDSENYIDADEIAADEIPADLWKKVNGNWARLAEVGVQARRDRKWKILRTRVRFSQQPPNKTPDEICFKLCEIALNDAAKNGEAEKYRARLDIRMGDDGATVPRFAMLKTTLDSEGALQITDGDGSDEDRASTYNDHLEQVGEVGIRVVTTLADAAESFGRINRTVEDVLRAHADAMRQQNEDRRRDLEREILLKEMEMRETAIRYDHEERMDRQERLGDFLEEMTDPLVDMVQDAAEAHFGPSSRSGSKRDDAGSSDDKRERRRPRRERVCKLARSLNDFYAAISEEQLEKFNALFDEDQIKLFEGARKCKTDDEFIAMFVKLEQTLARKYGDDPPALQKAIVGAVGVANGIKLDRLIKTVVKRSKGK